MNTWSTKNIESVINKAWNELKNLDELDTLS